jgi:APA family basic amino acid/polyamine antiporter
MVIYLIFVVIIVLIFYILTILGIFILRRKMPDAERPYKVLLPVFVLYIVVATCYLRCLFLLKQVRAVGVC